MRDLCVLDTGCGQHWPSRMFRRQPADWMRQRRQTWKQTNKNYIFSMNYKLQSCIRACFYSSLCCLFFSWTVLSFIIVCMFITLIYSCLSLFMNYVFLLCVFTDVVAPQELEPANDWLNNDDVISAAGKTQHCNDEALYIVLIVLPFC